MKRRSFVWLLVLVLVFVMAAGVFTVTDAKAKMKVAYSCGQDVEERWQREIGMFKAAFAKAGVDFSYQMASYDSNKQISQCENFINQGVNVLIITPADADAAAVIADDCKKAGVKVVVYDQPLNSKNVDYLCTFDAVETGELNAKTVYKLAPKGNYIILYGDNANMNAQNIKIGNANILGEAIKKGDIKVVMEQWVKSWDPNEAQKLVENALTANNNNIQAIIAPNDGTAGGAIQALAAQKMAGKIPICGQDADLAACQRVVQGIQTMTIYKNLMKLNKGTVQVCLALLQGKDPKKATTPDLGTWSTFTIKSGDKIPLFKPVQIAVTKENMKKEIIDTGFHKLEEVYANVPKDQWPK